MHPLIIGGIVSAGTKLIDYVTGPKQEVATEQFEALMKAVKENGEASPLNLQLAKSHVFDFEGVTKLKEQLKVALKRTDPQTMEGQNMASTISQLETIEELHELFPGASLKDLANKVSQQGKGLLA